MTTVAYRDGVLASDTQVTSGSLIRGRMTKVFKVIVDEKILLIGGTGDQADVLKFRDWIVAGCPEDKRPQFYNEESRENFCALVVSLIHGARFPTINAYWGDLYPRPSEDAFYAIGSGRDFAMGAMVNGATAREAVTVAGSLDIYTSGLHSVGFHD